MRKYEVVVISEYEAKFCIRQKTIWTATNVFIEDEWGNLRPYKERWRSHTSAVTTLFLPQNPSCPLDTEQGDGKIME